jgi:hypothetical protein
MDLRYPNKKEEENPDVALDLARKTLNKGREEESKKQIHRRRCAGCNEKFHLEELTVIENKKYCNACAGKDIKYYPVLKKTSAENSSLKQCFFCDGNAFHIMKNGSIQCVECGAEFHKK